MNEQNEESVCYFCGKTLEEQHSSEFYDGDNDHFEVISNHCTSLLHCRPCGKKIRLLLTPVLICPSVSQGG